MRDETQIYIIVVDAVGVEIDARHDDEWKKLHTENLFTRYIVSLFTISRQLTLTLPLTLANANKMLMTHIELMSHHLQLKVGGDNSREFI